jgi:hypothetical protein
MKLWNSSGPSKTGDMKVSAAVIARNVVFWDGRL